VISDRNERLSTYKTLLLKPPDEAPCFVESEDEHGNQDRDYRESAW